jgi:HPt (histidine-containing phosphotransfer) domain-containing protein
VVSTEVQSNIDQIAECKDVWDGFKKKSDAASAAYQASELKDEKATDDDMRRYEDEGFRAYCRCFEQQAKMDPFFKQLTKQAQTLVDTLQKQLPR